MIKLLHTAGGLLVIAGALFQFFNFGFSCYVFAIGVVMLIIVQAIYMSQAKDQDIRLKRINRLMSFATLLLALGAYLMYTGDDRWVVLTLLYALLAVFLALRSSKAKTMGKPKS